MDEMDTNKINMNQILDNLEAEISMKSQPDPDGSSNIAQNYRCPFCPKIETGYAHLQNHVATAHFAGEMLLKKNQRKCYFCQDSFKSQDILVN